MSIQRHGNFVCSYVHISKHNCHRAWQLISSAIQIHMTCKLDKPAITRSMCDKKNNTSAVVVSEPLASDTIKNVNKYRLFSGEKSICEYVWMCINWWFLFPP